MENYKTEKTGNGSYLPTIPMKSYTLTCDNDSAMNLLQK